jgi:hypothetical protein
MAAYGIAFIYGIPTQQELLEIQQQTDADRLIVSCQDFVFALIDGKKFAVEKTESGYQTFETYQE